MNRRDNRRYPSQGQISHMQPGLSRRPSGVTAPNSRMRSGNYGVGKTRGTYRSNQPAGGTGLYNGVSHRTNAYGHHGNNFGGGGGDPYAVGGAFFLGNIDKALSREEVYDFIRQKTCCYISKFDMPNVTGEEQDTQGRPIRCAGFAFVHVRHQWMADEMLQRGTIKIGGLQAEIKPYDQAKRMVSERRHRESLSRNTVGDGCQVETEGDGGGGECSSSYQIEAAWQDVVGVGSACEAMVKSQELHDWTIEEDTEQSWRQSSPVHDWNVKIGKYASLHEESAYQTEDESISHMSQSQPLNPHNTSHAISSYSNSRPQSPSHTEQMQTNPSSHTSPQDGRVRPSPLRTHCISELDARTQDSVASNNAMMVGAVTQELLDEEVTPTIERINHLVAEKYNVSAPLVQVKEVSAIVVSVDDSSIASRTSSTTRSVAAQRAARQVEEKIKHLQTPSLVAQTAAAAHAAARVIQQRTAFPLAGIPPASLTSATLSPAVLPPVTQIMAAPLDGAVSAESLCATSRHQSLQQLLPIAEQITNSPSHHPHNLPPVLATQHPLAIQHSQAPYTPTQQPTALMGMHQQFATPSFNHQQQHQQPTLAQPYSLTTLFTESATYQELCMSASQILHQSPQLAIHYQIMFNAWTEYYHLNQAQTYSDARLTEAEQVERFQQTVLMMSHVVC